ncbi:MAG TPA: polymorphic toxin-type HINT domain-containing protein [Gaiellaceae bacterium]|nr:polymorphic toxin-type HINT domain-containing protein [Gaiellaceae bacterium]
MDSTEREATRAETNGVPRVATPGQRLLHRQVDPVEAYLLYEGYIALREYTSRDDVVELAGHPRFEPDAGLADWIEDHDEPVDVRVKFGDIAHGAMRIFRDGVGYQSVDAAPLALSLTDIQLPEHVTPVLLVWVIDDVLYGHFGGVDDAVARSPNPWDINAALIHHGIERLIGFRGLDEIRMPSVVGHLASGLLLLPPTEFQFELDSIFAARGEIGIVNGNVVFNARADLKVPHLGDAQLNLTRDPSHGLSGTAQMDVALAGFHGSLLATFGDGILDIRGVVSYTRDGFEGSLTLLVTDAASAWAAVNGELAQWNVAAMSRDPPSASGAPAGTTAPLGAPSDLAITGWGIVDFQYKDWLAGRAQVIVDPDGDITSLGRIYLPRRVQIFDRKVFEPKTLFEDSFSFEVANLWDVFAVRVGARGNIIATAEIGPLELADLRAAGAFSTRAGFVNTLMIAGRLELPAALTVAASIVGGISVVVQVPLVGDVSEHFRYDVASTTLNLQASVELEALASADASIHRTRPTRSGDVHYLLSGVLTAHGSATLLFGGDVEVNVPGHTAHLLSLDQRRWLIGTVSASARFANYALGEGEPPRLDPPRKVFPLFRQLPRTILRESGIPDRPGPDDATADWRASGPPADVVAEQPEATPPEIPADPKFGQPTGPPVAPSAVEAGSVAGEQAPPPPPPTDDGTRDAGPEDEGEPGAGVPEVPAPLPAIPDAPPVTHTGDVVARFDMDGVPHTLTVTPGDPPVLVMQSAPGRLVLKLQAMHDDIDGRARDPISGARWQPQLNTLVELLAEARQVESTAAELGYGDRFPSTVPGLQALAAHLRAAGRQFGWTDLDIYLPPENAPNPAPGEAGEPGGSEPLPPSAGEVLGLPYAEFLARVDAMQPAEALPLLREQRQYYSVEAGDLSQYRGRARRPPLSPDTAAAIERRFTELIGRIRELDVRIRRLEDVLQPGSRSGLPCFAEGTLVLTPNGARPIDRLAAGDQVWSHDVSSGQRLVGCVAEVHRKAALRFVRVTAAGQSVRATGRHPFWVEEVGDWVAAEELEPGMHLRLYDGGAAPIENVAIEPVDGAPTFDLSIEPQPTYFVGPGVLVHNAPPAPPALRHYVWRNAAGVTIPSGNYKIYLGTNPSAPEWDDYMYVGQTFQSISVRQEQHRRYAADKLADLASRPDTDPLKRNYLFRSGMVLTPIIDGLLNEDQADWLEQKNIDEERGRRQNPRNLMNLREELKSTGPAVEARIRQDPIVRASGYCP